MAIKYICDGCSAQVEKPEIRGHVIKKHYCNGCVSGIDEFLAGLASIHKEAADLFKTKAAELKQAYKDKNPLGVLPDES